MLYTLIVFTENQPGVLYRTADLFLRRKINIESLTVSETEKHGISRFTIVVRTEKNIVEKLAKQLYRIIEVLKVIIKTDHELVFQEVALIKVTAKNLKQRKEIEQIIKLSKSKVVMISHDWIMVEKTGIEEKINRLIDLLKPYGIKELVRSGRIALIKS